jgi:hypothetical protein
MQAGPATQRDNLIEMAAPNFLQQDLKARQDGLQGA